MKPFNLSQFILLLLSLSALPNLIYGQSEINDRMRNRVLCNFSGDDSKVMLTNKEVCAMGEISKDNDLKKLLVDIQTKVFTGITTTYRLRTSDKINNAVAHFDDTNIDRLKRDITINPSFFKDKTPINSYQQAIIIFVLAHELTHHVLTHTDYDPENVCTNLFAEIEADDRAGKAVAMLSNVDISFFDDLLPRYIKNITNSDTHPALMYRLMVAKAGWAEGRSSTSNWIYTSNGIGKCTYTTGDIYYGQINSNNKAHGKGLQLCRENKMGNKAVIFGEFENGLSNSSNMIYYWENGDKYIGESKNGERSKGTYISADGYTYIGNFANSTMNGAGEMKYSNGDTYIGNFKEGLREGYGIYKFADGTIYKGFFKNHLCDGDGFEYKGTQLTRWGCWKEGKYIGVECGN